MSVHYNKFTFEAGAFKYAEKNIEKEYFSAKREIDNVLLTAYEIEIIQREFDQHELAIII